MANIKDKVVSVESLKCVYDDLASSDINKMELSGRTLVIHKNNKEKLEVTLPSTGSSDSIEEILIATKSTTFSDIENAISQGKICYYNDSNNFYSLSNVSSQSIRFYFVDDLTLKVAHCNSDSTWSLSSYDIQLSTMKKNSIDSDATNDYYPSCKAVYDFVNGLIGSFDTAAASIDEIIGG